MPGSAAKEARCDISAGGLPTQISYWAVESSTGSLSENKTALFKDGFQAMEELPTFIEPEAERGMTWVVGLASNFPQIRLPADGQRCFGPKLAWRLAGGGKLVQFHPRDGCQNANGQTGEDKSPGPVGGRGVLRLIFGPKTNHRRRIKQSAHRRPWQNRINDRRAGWLNGRGWGSKPSIFLQNRTLVRFKRMVQGRGGQRKCRCILP